MAERIERVYRLLRPLLFRLDAERAHGCTLALLNAAYRLQLLQTPAAPVRAPVRVLGLEFPNRVGIAAGFDKNGTCIDALGALGFGFIEVGTVTPLAQPGNARPRIFRIVAAQAIINSMGFPNGGVVDLCARLRARRFRGVCGVNIGKNAATPLERAEEDYRTCLRAVYPLADYVAVNVSSPNTAGLRQLQQGERLASLLASLRATRTQLAAEHGRQVPLLVKLSPDLTDAELADTAAVIVSQGIDGVIATNTTLARPSVAGLPGADKPGGLSGPPLRELATAMVSKLRALLGARVPIIGLGGIDSPRAARAMFAAGADLVQLYSGLVYHGPGLVSELGQL
ncbi:MAG TPA: quinone-dependent dihydroorotate dehydrogenase [Steroidobacteraceae bacterium]|nr:quinone-dependent dihydroorotate dehydrogenase [Steroidobacteraceae bacterium]